MKTTPEEAFQEWQIKEWDSLSAPLHLLDGPQIMRVIELAFLAGAQWGIGELEARTSAVQCACTVRERDSGHRSDCPLSSPLSGDDIPPIANRLQN